MADTAPSLPAASDSSLALHAGCPFCGRTNDRVTGLSGVPVPVDGDATVCFGCSKVGIFTSTLLGLEVRTPTHAEQAGLDVDESIQHARRAVWRSKGLAARPVCADEPHPPRRRR